MKNFLVVNAPGVIEVSKLIVTDVAPTVECLLFWLEQSGVPNPKVIEKEGIIAFDLKGYMVTPIPEGYRLYKRKIVPGIVEHSEKDSDMEAEAKSYFGATLSGLTITRCDYGQFKKWYEANHTIDCNSHVYEVASYVWDHYEHF